ncbi:hypothetical protein [Evansella tamaricis]|uniref:Uncharacterized protein n=1 Tax=Evansella tamaricis TaxID=2069301 RepID=A0ABS6JK74_9BACI|nr:hypothetical protein [Evansella tamaricis]MBU9714057.1 hypothetical protein [Evansella tamaricis]
MKSLYLEKGLLYTEMSIIYNGQTLTLRRVLVNTTSLKSGISVKLAKDIGLISSECNTFSFPMERKLDYVSVGPLKVKDFKVEIDDYRKEVDGVIGLDFLKKVGAKINLDSMTLSGSRVS